MPLPKYNSSHEHLSRKIGTLGRMSRDSIEHFLAGRGERGEIEQISWLDNKTVTIVELFFPPPEVHLIRYENDVWPKHRKVILQTNIFWEMDNLYNRIVTCW